MLCLQGYHCFIICVLCHCSVLGFDCLFFSLLRHYTISSRFALFHYLFVTTPCYLFKVSIVLVRYLLITSLLCSRLRLSRLPLVTSLWFLLKVSIGAFIICLLCHCCVLYFDCLFLCFVTCTSLCFLLTVSIVSLSVCYVSALF